MQVGVLNAVAYVPVQRGAKQTVQLTTVSLFLAGTAAPLSVAADLFVPLFGSIAHYTLTAYSAMRMAQKTLGRVREGRGATPRLREGTHLLRGVGKLPLCRRQCTVVGTLNSSGLHSFLPSAGLHGQNPGSSTQQ